MRIATVPARTGLGWLREGYAVFVKQPLAFGSILFGYLMLSILSGILPFINMVAPMLLAPFAVLAFMQATRLVLAGKAPWPTEVMAALAPQKGLAMRLLQLGLVGALCFFLAMGAGALVDGGTMWKLALTPDKLDESVLRTPGLVEGAFLTLLLLVLGALLLCVAPGLVGFDGYSAAKATFASALVAIYNWRALLVFIGASLGTAYLVLTIAAALLVALLSSPVAAQMALVPLMLMLLTPSFVSIYPIYRDTLIREAAPPDPAAA